GVPFELDGPVVEALIRLGSEARPPQEEPVFVERLSVLGDLVLRRLPEHRPIDVEESRYVYGMRLVRLLRVRAAGMEGDRAERRGDENAGKATRVLAHGAHSTS